MIVGKLCLVGRKNEELYCNTVREVAPILYTILDALLTLTLRREGNRKIVEYPTFSDIAGMMPGDLPNGARVKKVVCKFIQNVVYLENE